jgi:hypothetical protein
MGGAAARASIYFSVIDTELVPLKQMAVRLPRAMSKPAVSPFRYFNSSPEVIRLVMMMYVRYPLSLRNVEDLLFERGIDICHETVKLWWKRLGPPTFALIDFEEIDRMITKIYRRAMTMVRPLLVCAFVMAGIAPARAGTQSETNIFQLVPGTGAFAFLMTGGTRASVPSCASANPNSWVVDVSTPQGQALAASIMTAFATGKKIYIQGTGACPAFNPATEQVFFVAVTY